MEKLEKINLKNQKGITLIALVVTIVVLLILAGITINMGTQSIKDSREDTLLSELGMVQNAVLQRKTKIDLTDETDEAYPGDKIDIATVNSVIAEINSQQTGEDIELKDNSAGKENNYYLLTTSNNGLNNLGITKSENEYIVNYETGEVINSTTKVTESGKPLYIYAKEVN